MKKDLRISFSLKSAKSQKLKAKDSFLLSKSLILFITILLPTISLAQDKPTGGDVILPVKYATINFRASILPIVSFYTPAPYMTGASQATAGLGLSFRAEFKITPKSQMKILFGADYLNEGMKFDSYFFPIGTTPLYDKNFNYTHQLHISELYVPILFKQSFTDEDRNVNSVYVSGGWAFRTMLGANYKITEKSDGNVIAKGFSPLLMEHKFLTDNSGSTLMVGMGMEHKLPAMKNAVFFEAFFHYNLSRVKYTGQNNSNKVLFRNHSLTISVGYEF